MLAYIGIYIAYIGIYWHILACILAYIAYMYWHIVASVAFCMIMAKFLIVGAIASLCQSGSWNILFPS